MKIAVIVVRLLLGAVFVVFGLNGFLNFIEAPPMEGQAGAFVGALVATKYIYAIKILEIAGGLMLLLGRFVPLGMVVLGPIIVNIFLFHALMAPEGLPVASVILLLGAFLIWAHKKTFMPIFTCPAN